MISRLKIQTMLCHGLLLAAAAFLIYVLGFMTDFYVLFMDGNSEMYDYFKNLQAMNDVLFRSALIGLVMALFLRWFDIHKKRAGVLGLLYVAAVTVVSLVSGGRIHALGAAFMDGYRGIDFAPLEDYVPSLAPFRVTQSIHAVVMAVAVLLLAVTAWNSLEGYRKDRPDD